MRNLLLILFILLSHCSNAQLVVRRIVSPAIPLYSTLGNVELSLDATGLKNNTDNGNGVVTDGVVSFWRGISPGSTSLDFFANPVGPSGESNILKLIDGAVHYGGRTIFRSADGASQYDFLSYRSPATNLKSTVHMVLSVAQDDIPNWHYGLFGNNATSGGNRGSSSWFSDLVTNSKSDGVQTIMGAGGTTIVTTSPNDLITPNTPFVYTEETDLSQVAADRRKHYINGTLFANTAVSTSTAVVTSPTYVMEIGALGNNALPFRGWISHVVMQSRVETAGVRDAFIQSLIPYTRGRSDLYYHVDESKTYSVYNTYAPAGRYHFVQGLIQDPANPNNIHKIYHNGDQHVEADDKRVSVQSSTDRGRTWGTEFTGYDEDGAGTYAVQDGEWGWESTGTIHGITDWHTTIGVAGGTHKLLYHYGTDITSLTTIDITSIVPADGLNAFRAHGNIIEGGDGFIYACLYKATDEADGTQEANYILRKPVGASTTWTVFTVKAPDGTQISEMSIAALDASTLLVLARNETTKEWSQTIGTSNGSSWTAFADVTFSETLTVASPPLLTTFMENGTKVVAAWISIKEAATKAVKVVYATAPDLIASGVSGWDTTTKFTVVTGATQYVHYGRVLHYGNKFNAIGAYALEPNPFTATENSLITFHCPATQYFNTKTALGL